MNGRTFLYLFPEDWERTWISLEGRSRTGWLEAEIELLRDWDCETQCTIEMNMALRNRENRLFVVSDEQLLKVTGNASD